ncbi:MAG: low molecular weight protein arginine phosphatase [Candidatus Omnitrophica bacterium]|nr:low molecular weight protein arginine phosphatase [Candidatus Omnitrophota bacterium]
MKILFVCTGNSCRSVMAEGLFKKAVADRPGEFQVSSAGVSAIEGFPASDETIRAMKEEGVDMSRHRGRRLTEAMVREFDKILVMEKAHKDVILQMWPQAEKKTFIITDFCPAAGTGIPDPIRMSDYFYKNTLAAIKNCVAGFLKSL